MEIERKFLVKNNGWIQEGNFLSTCLIQQSYLNNDSRFETRVRTTSNNTVLTIKRDETGLSREEVEFPITSEAATQLIQAFCVGKVIHKRRTKKGIGDLIWEIDEYLDHNKGLVVAEVELESEDQEIDIPNWIGKEITTDIKYKNRSLTVLCYKDFED